MSSLPLRPEPYQQEQRRVSDQAAPVLPAIGVKSEDVINKSGSSNCGVSRSDEAFSRVAAAAAVNNGEDTPPQLHRYVTGRDPGMATVPSPSPQPTPSVLPSLSAIEEAPAREAATAISIGSFNPFSSKRGVNTSGSASTVNQLARTKPYNETSTSVRKSTKHESNTSRNRNISNNQDTSVSTGSSRESASSLSNALMNPACGGQDAGEDEAPYQRRLASPQNRSQLAARASRFSRLPVFGRRNRNATSGATDGNDASRVNEATTTSNPAPSSPLTGGKPTNKSPRSNRFFKDVDEEQRPQVAQRTRSDATAVSGSRPVTEADGNTSMGRARRCSFSANMYSPQPADTVSLPRAVLVDGGAFDTECSQQGGDSATGATSTREPFSSNMTLSTGRSTGESAHAVGARSRDAPTVHPLQKRSTQRAGSSAYSYPTTASASVTVDSTAAAGASTYAEGSSCVQAPPVRRVTATAVRSPDRSVTEMSIGSASLAVPVAMSTSRSGRARAPHSNNVSTTANRSLRSSHRHPSPTDESGTDDSDLNAPTAGASTHRSVSNMTQRGGGAGTDSGADDDAAPTARSLRGAKAVLRKHAGPAPSHLSPQGAAATSLRSSHGVGAFLKSSHSESFYRARSARRDNSVGSSAATAGRPGSPPRRERGERANSRAASHTTSVNRRNSGSPLDLPLTAVPDRGAASGLPSANVSIAVRPSAPSVSAARESSSDSSTAPRGALLHHHTLPYPAGSHPLAEHSGLTANRRFSEANGASTTAGPMPLVEMLNVSASSSRRGSHANNGSNGNSTANERDGVGKAHQHHGNHKPGDTANRSSRGGKSIRAVPLQAQDSKEDAATLPGRDHTGRPLQDFDASPVRAAPLSQLYRISSASVVNSSSSDEQYAMEHEKKVDAVLLRLTLDHKPVATTVSASAQANEDMVNVGPSSPAGPTAVPLPNAESIPNVVDDATVAGSWAGIGSLGWPGLASLGGGSSHVPTTQTNEGNVGGGGGGGFALFGGGDDGVETGDGGAAASSAGWFGVGGGNMSSEDWYARMRRKAAEEEAEEHGEDGALPVTGALSNSAKDEVVVGASPLQDRTSEASPQGNGPERASAFPGSPSPVPAVSILATTTSANGMQTPVKAGNETTGAELQPSLRSPRPLSAASVVSAKESVDAGSTTTTATAATTITKEGTSAPLEKPPIVPVRGVTPHRAEKTVLQPVPPSQPRPAALPTAAVASQAAMATRAPRSSDDNGSGTASATAPVKLFQHHHVAETSPGAGADEASQRAQLTPQHPANLQTILAEKAATPQPRSARRATAVGNTTTTTTAANHTSSSAGAEAMTKMPRVSHSPNEASRTTPPTQLAGSPVRGDRASARPSVKHGSPVTEVPPTVSILRPVAPAGEGAPGVRNGPSGLPLAPNRRSSLPSHCADGGEQLMLLPSVLGPAPASGSSNSPRKAGAAGAATNSRSVASASSPVAQGSDVPREELGSTSLSGVSASSGVHPTFLGSALITPSVVTDTQSSSAATPSKSGRRSSQTAQNVPPALVPEVIEFNSCSSAAPPPGSTRRASRLHSASRVLRDGGAAAQPLPAPPPPPSSSVSASPSPHPAGAAMAGGKDHMGGVNDRTGSNNSSASTGQAPAPQPSPEVGRRPRRESLGSLSLTGYTISSSNNSGTSNANVNVAVGRSGLHFAVRRRSSLPRGVVPPSPSLGGASAVTSNAVSSGNFMPLGRTDAPGEGDAFVKAGAPRSASPLAKTVSNTTLPYSTTATPATSARYRTQPDVLQTQSQILPSIAARSPMAPTSAGQRGPVGSGTAPAVAAPGAFSPSAGNVFAAATGRGRQPTTTALSPKTVR